MKATQLKFRDTNRFKTDWTIVQSFFDNLPYPIFEVFGRGSDRVTYCNFAFANLLEQQPPNIIGQDISSFANDAKTRSALVEGFRHPLGKRTGEVALVSTLKTRTGQTAPLAFDIMERSSDEGDDLGFLVIAQHFGQAGQSDAQSVRRVFAEIIERSGEAIGIAASDGTFLYRNPAHKELFGKADGPVGNLKVTDLLVQVEKDQTTASVFNDTTETGEWEDIAKLGEWVGLINCITPEGPKPTWIRRHHINDPVTDEPISFAFLHDYSKELSLLNELAEAKQLAERTRQTQRQLLHTVSHDLRAILQAASLYLATASNKIEKQGQRVDEIGLAQDAVDSVQDHFQKILNVLSSDSPTINPNIEYTHGQEILGYADQTYRALTDTKGIDIIIDGCDCVFPTDISLMKRIVGNLVSNAIKFTDGGSVHVKCTETGKKCVIQVIDTGIGIPPEYHTQIFDQFFQIDSGAGDDGLGVGLPIAKQLCDLLGHTIDVVANENGGSIFTVSIDKV